MVEKRPRSTDKTKALILEAAASLLIDGGASALKINDLAARAGIGKPLIYRYFGGLDGVFGALVEDRTAKAVARIKKNPVPVSLPVPKDIYQFLMFGRMLAFDECLRTLFRGLLTGDARGREAEALLALVPIPGEGRDAAASAFLLAGIGFLVLLRDNIPAFAGAGLETPKDMARFEEVFVELAGVYFKG